MSTGAGAAARPKYRPGTARRHPKAHNLYVFNDHGAGAGADSSCIRWNTSRLIADY